MALNMSLMFQEREEYMAAMLSCVDSFFNGSCPWGSLGPQRDLDGHIRTMNSCPDVGVQLLRSLWNHIDLCMAFTVYRILNGTLLRSNLSKMKQTIQNPNCFHVCGVSWVMLRWLMPISASLLLKEKTFRYRHMHELKVAQESISSLSSLSNCEV